MGMQPRAGEHVHDAARGGFRVEDAVGRKKPCVSRASQFDEPRVEPSFTSPRVPLHLHKDTFNAKDGNQAAHRSFRLGEVLPQQSSGQRAFFTPGQANHPVGDLVEFIPTNEAFSLGSTQFRAGEQSAQPLVAVRTLDQQRQHAAILHRQFASVDASNPNFLGRRPKPGAGVEPVPVRESERG